MGSKANRATSGEKRQGAVNACARDEAVAEEREAIGDRSAAYGSIAEPGESGSLR